MIAGTNSLIWFSVLVTDEWKDTTSGSLLRWNVSEYRITVTPERPLMF